VIKARDFVAVHARDEYIVARIVDGIAGLKAHAIGDAPAAQVLAGPGVGEIGGRKFDVAVGLFDDKAADAAPSQLAG
jgi:hypothetical protein